ncbi:coronafacic acid beta-ketoacyl synthetase component (plasmid) [Azospirillum sp. B510]|uniref:beta-ketoacyl-[acyl-carrier-protein] synthase family protein n=1 Tax=Azospirillum sp. (strain B510) TaxID=137722 RepID=UPI0001C4B949|nr:beta-ketoacyl-[acyl-carrier-protein] synthase family protein [Azospirillum sp. B510]BAI73720.1 coronafacic acid beta-ketoacyl synthetase component [Azospirillum sp. B510]
MTGADTAAWVTGMAWSTCLGDDVAAVWAALTDGASGIVEHLSDLPLRSMLAARITEPDQGGSPAMRQVALTADTARRALDDAGLDASDNRLRAVFGTSYGANLDDPDATSLSDWSAAAAAGLTLAHPPLTTATACSAGSDALLVGLALLRSGAAEICLCGGADVLTPGKRLGHSTIGTMSGDGLFAFDQRRSGTVLGEGAAMVVLETVRSARARGARPRGVLAGAGSSSDAMSATAPDPSGRNVILAVERALDSAGLTADAVGLINAHGSGTPVNDDVEACAYTEFFARVPVRPLVFATKGAFGHTLGATGAIEAVATLLALDRGEVPPIHGLASPLPALGLPVARSRSACPDGAALSVTLGFGGFNTCLVFQVAGSRAA